MEQKQSGHITGGPARAKTGEYPTKGAMNMHKRLAMGHFDVEKNPNGVGSPSKENKVGNDKKGW